MIAVKNLRHFYNGPPSVLALDDVSFSVSRSETLSLVGQSGCGKTTILRAIAGLLTATSGQIEIEGMTPDAARSKVTCGFVAQTPELFPWKTVAGNILLPFELRSARSDQNGTVDYEKIAKQNASLVGLDGFWEAYPHQLSGGMRARAALARALTLGPKALLLDEPFSSLDEITRRKLNEDLLTLQQETKLTVVLVTHSIREAAILSDRVVVISPRPGRVRRIFEVPHRADRLRWRETGEFSSFCSAIYEEVNAADLENLDARTK